MPDSEELTHGVVDRIGDDRCEHVRFSAGVKSRVPASVPDHEAGMEVILKSLTGPNGLLERAEDIAGVGHRVVHGGESFTGSVEISSSVLTAIEHHAALAPLHNPPNLVGIRAAKGALPGAVQVACFDTAFHARIPRKAFLYAVPLDWYERFGIRRYGFHGTSHRFVARRAAELLDKHKYELDCITCHLGNGCSVAAVKNGYAVDTSMGMTPLEGLVMGTRSGDIDPAIIFFLLDKGFSRDEIETALNKKSGLLGLSGTSNDMRTLLRASKAGDEDADLAIEVFSYRVRKYVGAYIAALGNVDCIVLTGGIGEKASEVRSRVLEGMDQLGIHLDPDRNRTLEGEGSITKMGSPIPAFVIPTDEERAIAADTYDIAKTLC
jgi:acetate kinase